MIARLAAEVMRRRAVRTFSALKILHSGIIQRKLDFWTLVVRERRELRAGGISRQELEALEQKRAGQSPHWRARVDRQYAGDRKAES